MLKVSSWHRKTLYFHAIHGLLGPVSCPYLHESCSQLTILSVRKHNVFSSSISLSCWFFVCQCIFLLQVRNFFCMCLNKLRRFLWSQKRTFGQALQITKRKQRNTPFLKTLSLRHAWNVNCLWWWIEQIELNQVAIGFKLTGILHFYCWSR